jgi:hypothetical protein
MLSFVPSNPVLNGFYCIVAQQDRDQEDHWLRQGRHFAGTSVFVESCCGERVSTVAPTKVPRDVLLFQFVLQARCLILLSIVPACFAHDQPSF